MKYTLQTQIQELITAYNANYLLQAEAYKATWEPFKSPAYMQRFTVQGMRATIGEQLDQISADWKKYDVLLNQRLKQLISDTAVKAKNDLLISTGTKPSDYAVRIANAREFLAMELDDIDHPNKLDDGMHFILQEFVDDYDTMKLFKKMVERKVKERFYTPDGQVAFPKTFGKLGNVECIMNIVAELEADAEMLFIYKRNGSAIDVSLNGNVYGVPFDGYAQTAGVESILNNAKIFDTMMNRVHMEGQGVVTTATGELDHGSTTTFGTRDN